MRPEEDAPAVAIVMPAYNAGHLLGRTLPPLLAAAGSGTDVCVVDAGSTDDTGAVARTFGVRVLRLPERAGPAEARNVGVASVEAPVVLFIDADCAAHADVVARVREAFRDAGLASLTGSYDDAPPDPGFFSQYMNLRHHHTHQRAKTEDATFWAGCGAVRRDVFERVGGFDAARYPRPMIEDLELGLRLRAEGATRLDPNLHVTHLKRWTCRGVVTTDIFARAVPWTALILDGHGLPNDLNLRLSQRVAALLAPAVLAAPVAVLVAARLLPITAAIGVAVVAAAVVAVSVALQLDMVRFFVRRRGLAFGVGAYLFHQIHLTYSATTYVLCTLRRKLARRGAER